MVLIASLFISGCGCFVLVKVVNLPFRLTGILSCCMISSESGGVLDLYLSASDSDDAMY
jgi:hypothetical protein